MPKHDPYTLLNIPSNATQKDITNAYRKLVRQFHPDKNTDSTERFIEIKAAYDSLISPQEDSSLNNQIENTPESIINTNPLLLIQFQHKNTYADINTVVELSTPQINRRKPPYQDNPQLHNTLNLRDDISKYQNIPSKISENAFMWLAEKEGVAPIYLFSSVHEVLFDFEDRFGDAINNILDKVNVVYTEIEASDSEIGERILPEGKKKYCMDYIISQKAASMNKTRKALETYEIRDLIQTILENKKLNIDTSF